MQHCNKQKHDVIDILKCLIEDMIELDKEIYFNMLTSFKTKANNKNMDCFKINTFDSFLSTILCECLDYVLRFKRDFLKNLTSIELNQLCDFILKILKE